MKVSIQRFIGKVFSYTGSLLPKRDEILVIECLTRKMDAERMYEILKSSEDRTGIPVRFVRLDPRSYKSILRVVRNFLRARYIIYDDIFPVKSRGNYVVNVWHGLPGKKTGRVANKKDLYYYMPEYIDIFTSPSEFFARYHMEQFGLDEDKVAISGNIRMYDMDNNQFPLSKVFGVALDEYEKVILYAPTYRYSSLDFDIQASLRLLKDFIEAVKGKNEYLYVIKPHQILLHYITKIEVRHPENVILLTNDDLEKYGIWIYNIISQFDAVISDYSSILFDAIYSVDNVFRWIPDKEMADKRTGFLLTDDELGLDIISDPTNLPDVSEKIKALRRKFFSDIKEFEPVQFLKDVGIL